ncbi:MAG TPA: TolC family protein [Candidatus Polarisedimenticolaceae bacterium]|nr:TolC family protein [Candidatus Polarisedimenticolaceae bacterium]
MDKRVVLSLVLSAALGVGATAAQEPGTIELSLDETLRMALENNLELVSARYAPAFAEQDVRVQRSNFDAAFEAFYDRSESSNAVTSLATVTGDKQDMLSLGIQHNLTMGANYTVGFQTLHQEQTGPQVVAPGAYFSGVAMSLTMPILKGFGTTVTTETLVLAQQNHEISMTDLEAQAETVIQTVEGAYWDVVAAREALRIERLALARAQDLLELNRKKVEVGTLAPIEITQAEAGVASQEEGVIVAETTLQDAQDELLRLMAIPDGDPLWETQIQNSTRPVFDEREVDVDAAIELALANRAEVAAAEQTLVSRELSQRVARRQVRHQLDFSANYTPQGSSLDAQALIDPITGNLLIPEQNAELEESIARIYNGDLFNWNARLTYRVPIGNRAAKAQYARAQLATDQAGVDLLNQEQTVRVEVRRAARGVTSGIKRVEAARKNVELQQKKLDAEQKKFENGMSTSFEVLTFQNDLADAELGEIRARLDYIKSVAALERSQGTLLEARGLRLDVEPASSPDRSQP